ncbi:M16 family metallopeptidase [Chondromyces apiculatus]|uniref:Putative zinc protease n=1 Tax=Chondromyces apiculatus DSM 436 TaxID=1192034 RepID=A0A017T1Q9_9BACT|nr:pitrilysin family protein [Chondromyces apiculatus]EYF03153.1 putative zinc protease [Chondromyces apiculatus DSM 436]
MSSTPIFVESSRALPLVSAVVAFRSGAGHDPAGREGLARITARMLRRGAEGYTAARIEETTDSLGGELSVDVGFSASSVHLEVIKRSLDPFAGLGATVLSRPTFEVRELERLLREAEAEIIESQDLDQVLCSRAFRRTLFTSHPYGRPSEGTVRTLRTITGDDVRAFYRQHYTRRNAVVAISGDVDQHEAQDLVARILADLPEGTPATDPIPPPLQRPGRHLVFVDKPERTQAQLIVGSLGTDAHDADHVPLLIANTVLGGTFSSRLMQEIRVKRGWSYGAYSHVSYDRHRDAFSVGSSPAANDASACLKLTLEMLQAFIERGVTEDEFEFAKRYLIRSHAFDIDTARKRVHQSLVEALLDMPVGYHESYVARLEAATLAEANAAIHTRLSFDNLVLSVVGTHADIGQAIQDVIPGLSSVEVLPPGFDQM